MFKQIIALFDIPIPTAKAFLHFAKSNTCLRIQSTELSSVTLLYFTCYLSESDMGDCMTHDPHIIRKHQTPLNRGHGGINASSGVETHGISLAAF